MKDQDIFPIVPLHAATFPPFVHYSGEHKLLTDAECDAIIASGTSRELFPGSIGNGADGRSKVDQGYRAVMQNGLFPTHEGMRFLFERVREKVVRINNDFYRFDLSVMQEGFNFLKYTEAEPGKEAGHYNWHQDFGGGRSASRKLSVVVQLSDPKDYDGCRLELFTDRQFDPQIMDRGSMIVFPSWTPHQVTHLTRGTRYALACWVGGPQFR